jgi:threonylcarbamoyladenosine tRNA methylthiotransferase MtaB
VKTFSIITFGCRVNQAESRYIAESLCQKGWKYQGNRRDLVIINSCAVTHKAEKEVKQFARRVKRENPNVKLIITGCFTDKTKLTPKKNLIGHNSGNYQDKYAGSGKAIVKIQDGCNNFCSYCIVPFLRGRSVSRPEEEIIQEIRRLEIRKIKEIILTGIDIADYKNLPKLLKLILSQTTIKKISFGSININAFSKSFLDLFPNNRLASNFHIPLQSGCDATLKRMNRKYSISNFQRQLSNIQKKIPHFTFSTDIIVGFPGETDQEFNQSLKFLKSLKLTKIHVFRYSSRKGTVASKMEKKWGKVTEEIKRKRAQQIGNLLV